MQDNEFKFKKTGEPEIVWMLRKEKKMDRAR